MAHESNITRKGQEHRHKESDTKQTFSNIQKKIRANKHPPTVENRLSKQADQDKQHQHIHKHTKKTTTNSYTITQCPPQPNTQTNKRTNTTQYELSNINKVTDKHTQGTINPIKEINTKT